MSMEAVTSIDAAFAIKAYSAPAKQTGIQEKKTEPPQDRRIEDSVEISTEARDALNVLGPLPPLSDILGSFQENIAAYSDELQNRFKQAGIDTGSPVELSVDKGGNVRVSNDNPDKEKIEALFANDPEFANRFRGLTAAAEIRRAVEEHNEFSKAYEEDADAAITRFSYLFTGERSSEARFQYSESGLTVSFTDQSA